MVSARTAGWAVKMGSPEAPGEVDLVVDLLLDVEAKARLWKELDSRIRPDAVRLTLALSASVTEIAAASRFPDAVVGGLRNRGGGSGGFGQGDFARARWRRWRLSAHLRYDSE